MQGRLKRNFFTVVGAKTNNLKNLNVEIKLNSLTAITGISGGGKSSLAYGTLFAICKQQFNQLDSGTYDYSDYKVDSFYGSLPAIALTQNNYNSNPKSTIYSYLDVPSYLYSILPDGNTLLDHSSLRLNKPGNECPHCQGSRESLSLSESLIVDDLKPLERNPFKCWSGANLAKNTALLRAFCEDEGIDLKKSISELSGDQKYKVLNGESIKKFKVNFAFGGKRRSREERYVGPVKDLSGFSDSDKISLFESFRKFSTPLPCSYCDATGLDPLIYKESKVSAISFFDFLRHPVIEVVERLKCSHEKYPPALSALISQLETLVELGLGYVSLIRQIPTLSGGELQKLRFGQVCNTSISGVMFVMDEISSQISTNSHAALIEKMKNICANGNTIVMIEHNNYFIKSADQVICIGPAPGDMGGYIVPYVAPADELIRGSREFKLSDMLSLPSVSKNNVLNIVVSVPQGAVTGICGVSGSGKSSFAGAISEAVPGAYYVSQKQMRGNIRSTVATALDLVANIATIYSSNSNESRELFLPQPGKLGCCGACGGTGVVDFTRTFEKTIKITCAVCEGELFSDIVDAVKVCDMNVKEFYGLPLHSLPSELVAQNKKLSTAVRIAEALGVSHLSFNRKIGSLSGGESRRVKLLQALMSPGKDKILIIDEPGAGLDMGSAVKAINYIKDCAINFKAVLVIDHKSEILKRCDYLVEFGPGAGPEGGKLMFSGVPSDKS
ncbi:ATP-binding cassette domain-containing protein [Pseudomonas sp. FW300-N2A2]|uniref:ATP-binding cassette domain-containing protein n=1 Tax=Pseudomonas sp. FW300-N2A2 TaxID=2751316 RepID=UPI001A9291D3|nr:ATP-binding cassette domain-containing protein [Pseudomonas sp. FW300-N2A2]